MINNGNSKILMDSTDIISVGFETMSILSIILLNTFKTVASKFLSTIDAL